MLFQALLPTFGIIKTGLTMRTALYIITAILLIVWAVGTLGYDAGGTFHLVLVLALITLLIPYVAGRKLIKKNP